jgi:uncharacterized protein (TIGR03118 family)
MMRHSRDALMATLVGAAVAVSASNAAQATLVQSNLVSDIAGLAAIQDPNLHNPWGVSFTPTSPFWVSDQGTNLATLYSVTGGTVSKAPLEVAIPTTAAGPQGPTGQVSNSTTAFRLANGNPAVFIFANLNGTISAWNPGAGTTAQQVVTTPGAVYTGLAIANGSSGPLLYAANGAQNRIDVFDGSFTPTSVSGGFVDDDAALAGLVPFNVQNIAGQIYVTYAPPGRAAQIAAPQGSGAVAVFDTSGNLQRTLITDSALAAPWGLTLAPAGFDVFGGDLLVGNFSFVASEINAFNPVTGALIGTIPIATGNNTPGGLWALTFGNGGAAGNPNVLFFSDGLNGEADGLFASISAVPAAVPEPATLAVIASGLLALVVTRRRRRDSSANG